MPNANVPNANHITSARVGLVHITLPTLFQVTWTLRLALGMKSGVLESKMGEAVPHLLFFDKYERKQDKNVQMTSTCVGLVCVTLWTNSGGI